jgi:hypothetical protein
MVPVEDGKAQAEQGCLGIPLQVLAVGVADQKVHRLREQQ